jgi:hypothetical protein
MSFCFFAISIAISPSMVAEDRCLALLDFLGAAFFLALLALFGCGSESKSPPCLLEVALLAFFLLLLRFALLVFLFPALAFFRVNLTPRHDVVTVSAAR